MKPHINPSAFDSSSATALLDPPLAEAPHSSVPPDSEINILLVDDQPKNLLALEALLAAPGHNLVCAKSGPEALKHLLSREFALILMDVVMPGMGGIETAELIRQRDKCKRTPIIFLTAMGKSEIQAFKGYSVGAVDYLFKPVEPEILRSKVAVFVDLFRKTQEVGKQAEQLRYLERRENERRLAEERQRWAMEKQQMAMRFAQSIQQKLFPISAPAHAGFEIHGASHAADTMGGDYFDYIPLRDGSLAIAIGDVSGHGVGPALVMAATRAFLHALSMTYTDVDEILRLTNRALVRDCIDECFVTLMLARLDTKTGLLTYASAGHPSGYVLGPSGELKHVLESTSLPLGLDGDAEFTSAPPIQLAEGDVVVMFTDGITEAFGPDETSFGVDRALEVVRQHQHESAAEIVLQIDSAVTAFAGHRTRQDDTTDLVVKWSGADGRFQDLDDL